ncbi:hypothetical protein MS3_00000628 [Schistosoma haematobium]|uniref:DUF7041 domain-containing protein n=1 Tax=Schistosoma haematobium TaxID=6185 RepID=A0A922IKV1_SCHHA|nr:hypothetical protein MS3_00000628 [Schistosoma haematobium]KAH9581730.1 hypothetical protein MS3_00000628 [Schistosoma haematobium]CAH8614594.1 unnamed protein product [Schistosoma haematobium]
MSSPTKLIDMDSPPVKTFVSLSNSPENNFSPVNSISEFRLPTYGANNPRVWFAQIEALFMARDIRSQASKYAYVVGALPIEIAAEVGDLIDHVPESEPYDKIKAAVIQRTTVSDEKRLQQLLTSCDLGDKRPSQLLRHMKQLVGPYKLDEALLKQMWFQRLPHSVRQILSVSGKSVALDDLADMADKMMEVYHDNHCVNSLQPPGPTDISCLASFQKQLTQLTSQLASLQSTIATIQARQSRSPSRRRSFSRQRSRSPKRTFDVCWYHQKYGTKARRCTRPCTFSASDTENQGNDPARQ